MIAALGKLKDKGLRVIVAEEAVEGTQFSAPEASMLRAFELNKTGSDGITKIMAEAHDLCNSYFDSGMIDKLIAGELRES